MSEERVPYLPPITQDEANAAYQRLALRPDIPLVLGSVAAMLLISQLQLALRHPDNNGPSAQAARRFIERMRPYLADPGDTIDRLISMGYDSAYDDGFLEIQEEGKKQ